MARATFGSRLVAAGVVAVVAVASALADDPPGDRPEGDASAYAAPKPTKHHRVLRKDVGVWDAVVKTWMAPDQEPTVSKGIERNRLLRGGLWLVSDFQGQMGDMTFAGHGQYGYDTTRGRYVGSWVDSMSTSIMSMEGDYNAESDTMVMEGKATDAASGQVYQTRTVVTYPEDGRRIMTMSIKPKGTEGEGMKMMEISYTRRTGAVAPEKATPKKDGRARGQDEGAN